MEIYKKLLFVQMYLKSPKNQFNKFGGFKYRNLEDILEAAKPLLFEKELSLTISDTPILVGDRVFIESTATLTDVTDGSTIKNTAVAREALSKKGMDDAQISGAASSYARKYCLNGLFCIDDTKDPDSMDNLPKTPAKQPNKPKTEVMSKADYKKFTELCDKEGLVIESTAKMYGIESGITKIQFNSFYAQILQDIRTNLIDSSLLRG